MYPTLIVVLVYSKNSTEKNYGISTLMEGGEIAVRDPEARSATFGHLSFAVPRSTVLSGGSDGFLGSTYNGIQGDERKIIAGEDDGMSSKAERNRV